MIIFVCDPSSDETIPKLKELSNVDVKTLKRINEWNLANTLA